MSKTLLGRRRSVDVKNPLDQEVALALAAEAAIAWSDRETTREVALGKVMDALSATRRALCGRFSVRRPHEFLPQLSEPVRKWIPIGEDSALIEGGSPTPYCFGIADECGPTPKAEAVQAQIGGTIPHFANSLCGEEGYREFRRFLTKSGHAKRSQIVKALAASGLGPLDLYEEIPAQCELRVGAPVMFAPCPNCTWPMSVRGNVVECQNESCRSSGSRFHVNARGGLTAIGKRRVPQLKRARDYMRLKEGAWRYTLLPGLVELRLAKRLREIPEVTVDLWPDRDRYDLHVEWRAHEWRVDVKCWRNATGLARSLNEKARDEHTLVVVPDAHASQLPILREQCGAAYSFDTERGFLKTVRSAARASGCRSRGEA